MNWNFLVIFGLVLTLTSCGGIQKMAVGTTATVMYRGSSASETDGNWENFRHGTLGNLKLLEGMLQLKPNDEELLVTLIKGYAGYGFAVHETLHLGDLYQENDETHNLRQGVMSYSKAVRYGLRYFALKGINYKQFVSKMNVENGIVDLLNRSISTNDLDFDAVLFTAQAWGGMINLQKGKMAIVAQLPMPKALFDWACTKRPNAYFGICEMFFGAYEAGRPKFLGGDPQKAKKYFLSAIKRYPHNWLVRVSYMQYYLIPQSDEAGYDEQKAFMEKAVGWHISELQKVPGSDTRSEMFANDHLRIYQAISVERFKIMKKYDKEFF